MLCSVKTCLIGMTGWLADGSTKVLDVLTVVLLRGVRIFECYSTVWSVLPVVLPGWVTG